MKTALRLSKVWISVFLVLAAADSARATWSIILTDKETREVGIGSVTCLNGYSLLALVPVVVVGRGAAAVQASGDFDAIRRPIIFDQLKLGTPPEDIMSLLEEIAGHQSRQYGIVDTGARKLTFTGDACLQWAGGVTGTDGSLTYAIQGNILAGDCVVPAIEQAILTTEGDMPAKLMAGMQAAKEAGGDGRCSCDPSTPTDCGCPPESFTKSGHIGFMVVARIGDIDDLICSYLGCADGDYFMRFNVAHQPVSAPDPVYLLQFAYNWWRNGLVGRPDAIQSTVEFDPDPIPPDGTSTTTMLITLRDWNQDAITVPIESLVVEHAPRSAGISAIGAVTDNGDGTFSVPMTAGSCPGLDKFVITVDDGTRPVVLAPFPALDYDPIGDMDCDGDVDLEDFAAFVGCLSGPGDPSPPPGCSAAQSAHADLDRDNDTDLDDFTIFTASFTG